MSSRPSVKRYHRKYVALANATRDELIAFGARTERKRARKDAEQRYRVHRRPRARKFASVYVILGGQYGDEGKGKIMRFYLCESPRRARVNIRFNGGKNAGHTFLVRLDDPNLILGDGAPEVTIINGVKYIKFATHQLPSGIIFGIPSVIGYDAVVDIEALADEIATVARQTGRTIESIQSQLTIVPQAHVVQPQHIAQDRAHNAVGTTGSGIGPCYADKALRTGKRIQDFVDPTTGRIPQLPHVVIEDSIPRIVAEFNAEIKATRDRLTGTNITAHDHIAPVVFEGAQGFGLDPTYGNYPYVTSAPTTIQAMTTYGFPLDCIKPIIASKSYNTYVGSRTMEPGFQQDTPNTGNLELLRLIGHEYGVTTGRRRQCIIADLNELIRALVINQAHELVISKSDILSQFHQALADARNGVLAKHPDPHIAAYAQYLDAQKQQCNPIQLPQSAYQYTYNGVLATFDDTDSFIASITSILFREVPTLKTILNWDRVESEIAITELRV